MTDFAEAWGSVDAPATGLDPLVLLAEMGDLARTSADDFALWAGGGCVWEAERKALWCRIADAIRVTAKMHGEKMTEAAIEQAAHADAEYQTFIASARLSAAHYHAADKRLRYLEHALDYANGANYRAAQEAKVTR